MPIKPEDIKAIQAFAPATSERFPAAGRPSLAPHTQSDAEISGMLIKKVHAAQIKKVAKNIRGALVRETESESQEGADIVRIADDYPTAEQNAAWRAEVRQRVGTAVLAVNEDDLAFFG